MSYLKFDKGQLVNLEYSLHKEILRTNKAGSYICTTINDCNTRKYHGLLVSPIDEMNGEKHVLLSSLDVSVIQHGAEFNLGIRKYKNENYEPKGHKYIRNLTFTKIPKTTYRVGGVVLSKERILVEKEQQVLIKYTLEEANSPTILRFKPFLAFRHIHKLSKANMNVNTKFEFIRNGIKMKLYEGYPYLHMQLSKEGEFIPVPDWYYDVEYMKEKARGYEYLEDLYVPGYFEVPIEKGESIIFAAGTEDTNPRIIKQRFTREFNKRPEKDDFLGFLQNSAGQFFSLNGKETDVIAGYPWYGSISRQTFIALPGLCKSIGSFDLFEKVVDTYLKYVNQGLFPNNIDSTPFAYDGIDTSLWFIWSVQEYDKETGVRGLWKKYGRAFKSILSAFKYGIGESVKMHDNGLIWSFNKERALTWMDSYYNGIPAVNRNGYVVEINALWYNAINFSLDLARREKDTSFVNTWEMVPQQIRDSFKDVFWDEEKGYLADNVREDRKDWSVRPSMIIAAALDYSPVTKEIQKAVLSVAKKQLLTPRGLRTLSPEDSDYKGVIEGGPQERELATHLGAVMPWLIMFFVEGYLKIHKRGGLPFVKKVMDGFEEELAQHSIGTISETYNGNPPHSAKGAISQAWNVAGVVKAYKMVQDFE